jgi:hypothetical protein
MVVTLLTMFGDVFFESEEPPIEEVEPEILPEDEPGVPPLLPDEPVA